MGDFLAFDAESGGESCVGLIPPMGDDDAEPGLGEDGVHIAHEGVGLRGFEFDFRWL